MPYTWGWLGLRSSGEAVLPRSGDPTYPAFGVASGSPPREEGAAPVYRRCMSRTNIDLDDEACRVVMGRYHLSTKRDAVNLALRTLAAEPLDLDAARQLRGSGWDGDLDDLRVSRAG